MMQNFLLNSKRERAVVFFLAFFILLFSFTRMILIGKQEKGKVYFVEGSFNERINVNLANKQELMILEGVGKVTAKKIIEYRQANGLFANAKDLLKVHGIGAKKVERIKDNISF
jgi:competence ComEA-like helix-hairpin-helix protein